ncbi:uncharacterized protein LOC122155846 isoform X8 [Centrocercus urophasianus]|uniref:uncharacterized protein LOC122155846 isoform X8 n=1 Tax=Centrocercus urophasianus TaxID=9002 RepID=UPI001C6539E1|nr:uncharacterized protein LOC122155846 isoform X8 [Centrocercus urophasianus]
MLIRWILLCSLLVRLAQSNNQDSEKSANITTPSAKLLDASTKSKEHGKNKTLHIIYASVPVGLCCPFIFICVFWSLRRYYGNHKRTPSTPQRQESQVRSPSAFPSHAAGRTPATDENFPFV